MKITIIPKSKEFEDLLKLYPPVKAKDILPDWWKQLKPGSYRDSWKDSHLNIDSGDKFITAKTCPAIQDYFGEGIVLPLWGKMYIGTEKVDGEDFTYAAFTSDTYHKEKLLGAHVEHQVGDMPIGMTPQGTILKLGMPYKILVPDGYSVMYQDPFYHFRNDIRMLTGVVEADKWGYVAFPFSIENYNCTIEAGTPLVYVHVFKKEDIKLKVRKGTKKEYEDNYLEKKNFVINENFITGYKKQPKFYKQHKSF